jgi:hypothetical protein
MRHSLWIRVVLLLVLSLVATGSAIAVAPRTVVGGRDVAQLPSPPTDDMDGVIHVPPQSNGALQPADAPTSCTRIGFNNSLAGWTVHAGEWYTGTGYIYTRGPTPGGMVSISYEMDLTRTDFQARMWRSGCSTCVNGIVIRGNPEPLFSGGAWDTMYALYYRTSGQCAVGIAYYYNGQRFAGALRTWTDCPINQGDAWNTLRAVADGDQLSFYVNDQLFWSGQNSANSHGRVGIISNFSAEGEELRVEWASLCWPYGAFLPMVTRK